MTRNESRRRKALPERREEGTVQSFDPRQVMLRVDYEIAHKIDTELTDVASHVHDFYEVNLILSGHATYTVGDRMVRLGPEDVIAIAPGQMHQVFIDPKEGPYERYTLWIAPIVMLQLSSTQTDLRACFLSGKRDTEDKIRLSGRSYEYVRQMMDMLCRESTSEGYGTDIMAGGLMTGLLTVINRAAREQYGRDRLRSGGTPLVRSVAEFIEKTTPTT